MNKYELLASALKANNPDEALKILKKCEEYREDDTFNTLYFAVITCVTDWRLRRKTGDNDNE